MGWEAGILRAELRWHFIDRPTRAGGLRRRVRYGPGLDGGLEARWAAGAMVVGVEGGDVYCPQSSQSTKHGTNRGKIKPQIFRITGFGDAFDEKLRRPPARKYEILCVSRRRFGPGHIRAPGISLSPVPHGPPRRFLR